MFKKRTFTLILLAALLAVGAAYSANNWVVTRNTISEELIAKETHVVVATIEIPYGQKIDQKHINLVKMPKNILPNNYFSDPEEVIGKVARMHLLPGDILRAERIADHADGSTLAAMIAKNMRAITVRVDDVVGVAGFLLPGNRVDILATKGGKTVRTDTILKNVKVLAVDQTASTEKNEPVIVRAVTLELSPADAETLVKSRDEGRIQLSLRNPLEPEVIVAKKAVVPVKRVYRAPTSTYITVIRGTQQTVVKR